MAVARFAASFHTAPAWLQDLYLVLTTRFGDPGLVPTLIDFASHGHEAARPLALSALARITGWDARFDAAGEPRPVADVAADYARECSE